MKKAMYLSITMLCLALTLLIGFHLGSHSVQAQAPEPITGYRVLSPSQSTLVDHFLMLSNGDVSRQSHDKTFGAIFNEPPTYVGNFWSGVPVPVSESTWGKIKGQFK